MPLLSRWRVRDSADGYVNDRSRDVRAETRARALLAEVAGEEVAQMYEELGFVAFERRPAQAGPGREAEEPAYGYLVYPHRPLVAYDAESGELLSEYCVRFPDGAGDPSAGRWLPGADDVLAKWIALSADEHTLIAEANMHLLGRQHDPAFVRRDIDRMRAWRAAR